MNIFVSYCFNENYKNGSFSAGGNYNISQGLLSLEKKYKNFFVIGEDYFNKNGFQKYENLKKHYSSEINSITYIQKGPKYNDSYPNYVKQFRFIVDIHGWGDISKSSNGKLNLLLPYAYCYNIYNYTSNENVYFLPQCTKHKIDFNENPINRVLVSGRGRKNSEKYPMRVFMYKLSLHNSAIDYFKPNHGYRITSEQSNSAIFGYKFIKKLNEYLVCFVDDSCSNSPYLVCKFFEILSSGSLLLASLSRTKKYFEHLGFVENKHYISMTKDNHEEKIKFVLDIRNRKLIDKIRYDGYTLCNKYHTSEHRALQLREIIECTDNVIKYNDGISNTEYYLVKNEINS